MHLSILILIAVASATPLTLPKRDLVGTFPLIRALPIPSGNGTVNGFDSLGSLYTDSAGQLTSLANGIAQTNVALSVSGLVPLNSDLKASLASSLATVNNLFWSTAYQAEQKVCSILTSINQQNVNSVSGTLRAGITAEAQAVITIANTLANTVVTVKSLVLAFTDAEKAVIAGVIQAIAAAAIASLGPAATLDAGLTATGITAITDVVQSLQSAIVSLQATAKIDWNTS